MKIEYCIWDFNGTILDDTEACVISVNKMLEERGLPTIETNEDYYKVFRFPIKEYYRSLGFDFDAEPYEMLAPIWVELYLENVKKAGMFPDVKATLELFKSRGLKQVVISATEIGMLRSQLTDLGVIDYFEDILGLDNIHAASKLSLAKKWREEHIGKAVFIGDTDHDAETAEIMGAECVLIARGHQSREYLEENTDAYIFDDLTSALEFLDNQL